MSCYCKGFVAALAAAVTLGALPPSHAASVDSAANTLGASFDLTLMMNSLSVCSTTPSTSVRVGATYFSGSAPISLSVSGVPAPSTAVFDPQVLTPQVASSELTLSGFAGVPQGSYALLVTGTGAGSVSKNLQLNVATGLPGSVTPQFPADGATGVELRPTLNWQELGGASSYKLEVASDLAFSKIVFSQNGITSTARTLPWLSPGKTYYWRVTANSACGQGVVSSAIRFTTATEICSAPGIAISGGSVGVNDTIVLGGSDTLSNLMVSFNATHGWVGDLKVTLSKANAISVLIDRPGVPATANGCGGANIDAILDAASSRPVEDVCETSGVAIAGIVAPNTPGFAPFIGLPLEGTWTLNVASVGNGGSGFFNDWCLIPVIVDDVIFEDGFETH
ncbi:MAG: hypothetical protein IT467_00810 [Dokdonella sp.]|uniref:hypothetical protein n=1 Tax=Dokdonella sp. TaxID=2291710 RepID=UPI0025C01CCB|nr:hypothetical protein [Dokdonella sp.]MBZ0222816.1 hypothetical protein [Dokdonella sp.]MCC7254452.1 hypothetical protein [Dokdonella sp.]